MNKLNRVTGPHITKGEIWNDRFTSEVPPKRSFLFFRSMSARFFALFCLAWIHTMGAHAQSARYPITNFTTREYGRDFHPSNFSIVQDSRGIIYAANAFRMLEYDGRNWSSYPISQETWILSLAADPTGRIYMGSQNEFGYFTPDKKGRLYYISLSDSLSEADRHFTNVWKVHVLPGETVFQSEEALFIYRQGYLQIVRPETSFHTSFVVRNTLYVRQRGIGLMEWRDHGLHLVPGGEIFNTTGIFSMLPFGKGNRILVVSQKDGCWLYDPGNPHKGFSGFPLRDKTLWQRTKINGGVLLYDQRLALSTMNMGIIVIDTLGYVTDIMDHSDGLSVDEVKQVITDRDNNLWVALNNGLSMIGYSSPLSVYGENAGITGEINSLARINGKLYIATSAGLFYQQSISRQGKDFTVLDGVPGPVRSLVEVNGSLVAGCDEGIFEVRGTKVIRVDPFQSFTMLYSKTLDILVAGGPKGLVALAKITGRRSTGTIAWRKIKLPFQLSSDIIGMAEMPSEDLQKTELWAGTRYEGLFRITLDKKMKYALDRFSEADGLPSGPVTPFRYKDSFVFATGSGLSVFVNEEAVRASLPDSLKNRKELLRGYFTPFSVFNQKIKKPVTFLVEDRDLLWLSLDNQPGYFSPASGDSFYTLPFAGIDVGKINTIYPENKGVCWIGTNDGLVRYDRRKSKNYHNEYHSLVRKVTLIRTDSVLYFGSIIPSLADQDPASNLKPSFIHPELPFADNSLRFDFSAPFFEYPQRMLFSCSLVGYDTTWTPWETKYYQEYTNLPEGHYVFWVKARNVYGTESTPAFYPFSILPPWYRTPWAYMFYGVVGLLLIWIIIRLYTYRLKRENMRLEGIVRERTAEVVRQKQEIQARKEEIEDSIRYAQRIQSVVIPSRKEVNEILPESFVFFRPQGIVSGDFYWVSKVGTRTIVAAADCTGHGVPGAFMSMLGIAFLDEIVTRDQVTSTGQILDRLRNMIIDAMQQHGAEGEAKDGMDIALLSIDSHTMTLEYSGAYNPLIRIRNQEILEVDPDKMPIAIHERMHPFTAHSMEYMKGDIYYMFSDGFVDQFGGPYGKKFKFKSFRQLLLDIHQKSMEEQKIMLEQSLDRWKGSLPQVDDILVIGIQIP